MDRVYATLVQTKDVHDQGVGKYLENSKKNVKEEEKGLGNANEASIDCMTLHSVR